MDVAVTIIGQFSPHLKKTEVRPTEDHVYKYNPTESVTFLALVLDRGLNFLPEDKQTGSCPLTCT